VTAPSMTTVLARAIRAFRSTRAPDFFPALKKIIALGPLIKRQLRIEQNQWRFTQFAVCSSLYASMACAESVNRFDGIVEPCGQPGEPVAAKRIVDQLVGDNAGVVAAVIRCGRAPLRRVPARR
jgi:hypothetical protein